MILIPSVAEKLGADRQKQLHREAVEEKRARKMESVKRRSRRRSKGLSLLNFFF